MKQPYHPTRAAWSLAVLFLLSLLVQSARAADGDFDNPSRAFTWYSKGPGCIHLTILNTNASPECSIDANFALRDAEGNVYNCFYFDEAVREDDGVWSYCENYMRDESVLFLTNDPGRSPHSWIQDYHNNTTHHSSRTKGSNAYMELDWYYPTRLAGKSFTFFVDGRLWHSGGSYTTYKKDIGVMEFDPISFETFDPVPGTDAGDEGTVRVPFSCDRPILSVSASYTDGDGNRRNMGAMELAGNTYFGFLRLPASERHDNLTITASVVSASWTDNPSGVDYPRQVIGEVTKTVARVAQVHNPRLLKAELDSEGAVTLKWKIGDVGYDDMLEGDVFQVQRSLTGRAEDFQTLGDGVMVDISTEDYEYKDGQLMSALTEAQIDKTLGIPLVRYRVCRASTQRLWGMEKNPTVAYVQPQFSTLALLTPVNATARWADVGDCKVQVQWDWLKSDATHTYVWDSRAVMTLTVNMFNKEGTLVDSLVTELTDEQRRAGMMVLTLPRPCVTYTMRLTVDGSKSPVGKGTGNLFVTIGSKEDFDSFRDRVDAGETRLNAILTADISVGKTTVSASADNPYAGIFIGNGHSIEIAHNWTEAYTGLFRYAGNGAVFSQLTVKGILTTRRMYGGGLASWHCGGPMFVENCRLSLRMDGRQSGDCRHGGVVALSSPASPATSASLYISNTLFDGRFEDWDDIFGGSDHEGGFVGWRDGRAFAMIANSYYGPSRDYWTTGGSATFMRSSQDHPCWGIVQDCLYKMTLGEPQGRKSATPPDNWCWDGGVPVSGQVRFSAPVSGSTTTVALPPDAFLYENLGRVEKGTLRAQVLQCSALLTWSTDGNPVDWFEVWRKQDDENEWRRLVTRLTETTYEDKATSPAHDYRYFVRSANDCEGMSYEHSDTISGGCVRSGKVSGYVRFPDGTGIPGIQVSITPEGSAAGTFGPVETDESGYFEKEGLPYWNNGSESSYVVRPAVSGYSGMRTVTLGTAPGSNVVGNVEFLIETSVKFSGYVMYTGTSIPVQGVSFLVDGREVHTAAGKVTTDFEGKFAFRMLPNVKHSIQAVKAGHRFAQRGYYHEGKDTTAFEYDFNTDKANIYFYDDTRVELIGRVAGGKDQGAIPLGNSLSRNNLGDDLKMVFALEGDNASRLVFDVTNRDLKKRDETFIHKAHDQKYEYKTQVHTTEHRMEVTPDVHTGEYRVLLPPVKWKILQITAQGYPTLFQDGKTGDVIDLTDSVIPHRDHVVGSWKNANGDDVASVDVEYHAQYNRIYHSPVRFEYKQAGFENFDYFGEHYYTAKTLVGEDVRVPLCYPVRKEGWPKGRKDSLVAKYTFGYPVFSTDRSYPIVISATEKYYYNNNQKSDTVDLVKLSGGFVTIHNGLVSGTQRDTLTLDANGERQYLLKATQRPYNTTGMGALSTVSFSIEMGGTHYEATPLKAYTLSQYTVPGAKTLLSIERPMLVDILRDPPGGGSSATLSKGSTMKLSYQMDMSWKAGLSIGIKAGAGMNSYTGVSMIGAEFGLINNASSVLSTSFDLIFSGSGQRAFTYTMTANEDISTSSGGTMVGADADVYMGMVNNVYLKPTIAINALNDSIFRTKGGELQSGRMVEIASGRDDKDSLYHLVRSEMIGYGQKVVSTFAHSQKYIVKQLMPQLAAQSQALMFTGTESEAQALANTTGQRVYLSLIGDPDSERFGVMNTDPDKDNEYVYNSSRNRFADQSKMNYLIVLPNNDDDTTQEDKVQDYCDVLYQWASIIAKNEKEKLEATELVKNLELDGGVSMNYSENFSTDYTNTSSYVWLLTDATHNYFDDGNEDNELGNSDKNLFPTMAGILGPTVAKLLSSVLQMSAGRVDAWTDQGKPEPLHHIDLHFVGTKWNFDFTPVISYNVTPKETEAESHNRKESFSIKMDAGSSLAVDLYRVKTQPIDSGVESDGARDVFVENSFLNSVGYVEHFISRGVGSRNIDENFVYPKSFVYRTRGGATCRPWEDERTTKFYRPGTVLDERTKRIENPVIKLDKQSVSGVPYGEPARFKVLLTNDSEAPSAATGSRQFFTLYLDETSNPKGAKLMIDGTPLSGNGRTIRIPPGELTEKNMEVYAGEDFDYEDIKIGIISQDDTDMFQTVAFSVHFLREAGAVDIAMPGDKWIMNTDAPYDSIRGWYIPVVISGYNKNQKNFDHIEFQYKEASRGDDYWTNLCGFYADSTVYAAASGTKEMIPDNGYINTKFYGEGKVMEKAYNLRAMLFCRNGNGYITSASRVLNGVKDTRRPQLFGAPEPKDGILGAGENIVFNFSEPIEHNYLQETANFEVMGETNETAIQENPSLLFGGDGFAQSEARRNFADKSVTVEVLVLPDAVDEDLPVFSHGTDGKQLQLWITKEKKVKAVVDGRTLESDSALDIRDFRQVALVLDNDQKRLSLYGEKFQCHLDSVTYSGYGPLIFGSTNQADTGKRKYYKGRMLQGRVWNRVMDSSLLSFYGKRLLTGYEMGLIDYYPMNEGRGDYALDEAQGAHLTLNKATWSLPRGMSLHLDGAEKGREVKGMKLRSERFSRSDEQDYTLMFWFRTDRDGRGALLSNGAGRTTDTDARNKFFIGFEAEQLKYRSNGQEFVLGTTQSDDKWHHFAMTVNRSFQVANIYVDNVQKASFSTENLGGMTGDNFYLGNMVWYEEGPQNDLRHQYNWTTGYVDGICLFEQALPPTLIKRYSEKSVGGSEKGLVTFLGFNRQERQQNNDYILQPYAFSQKVYYDNDGKRTSRADTVFVDTLGYVTDHIDQAIGAPMQAYQELRNLNFSHVGRDNQLLVNIDELDARINKRRLFVTVYDMPDLNGNYMASPATTEVFVDRNPLRWSQRSFKATFRDGEDYNFMLNIINDSGAPHTYTIEKLPKWLSADVMQDVIEPKGLQYVMFTLNKGINVGSYDDVIYLTDENGLSEPLALNITIEGELPEWEVDEGIKQFSMNIVASVKIGDDIVTDSRDLVGVFDRNATCMGLANVEYNPASAEAMVYLSVFDENNSNSELYFLLWHYATGRVMMLTPSEKVTFGSNHTVGTTKKPLILTAGDQYVQRLQLKKGWNWISFNVYNNLFRDGINGMLVAFPWQDGDIVADETNNISLIQKNGQWMVFGTDDIATIKMSVGNSYRVKVANDIVVELNGTSLKDPALRTIKVKNGWNSIGYSPMVNLPVATALSDYLSEAEEGDVVKSKTEFAQFTTGDKGSVEWKGNLQYMKPGEGYLLFRKRRSEATFKYPFYEPNATFYGAPARPMPAGSDYANTMSLTAVAEGIGLQEGDKVIAFSGAEMRGESSPFTTPGSPLIYMSIDGDEKAPLSFAIERNGAIVAMTGEVMTYEVNAVSGTANHPTRISFRRLDAAQHGWYSLQGVRLQGKPSKRGVYIYNGHKQIIK